MVQVQHHKGSRTLQNLLYRMHGYSNMRAIRRLAISHCGFILSAKRGKEFCDRNIPNLVLWEFSVAMKTIISHILFPTWPLCGDRFAGHSYLHFGHCSSLVVQQIEITCGLVGSIFGRGSTNLPSSSTAIVIPVAPSIAPGVCKRRTRNGCNTACVRIPFPSNTRLWGNVMHLESFHTKQ